MPSLYRVEISNIMRYIMIQFIGARVPVQILRKPTFHVEHVICRLNGMESLNIYCQRIVDPIVFRFKSIKISNEKKAKNTDTSMHITDRPFKSDTWLLSKWDLPRVSTTFCIYLHSPVLLELKALLEGSSVLVQWHYGMCCPEAKKFHGKFQGLGE